MTDMEIYDKERELRLTTFHGRIAAMLMRKDASDGLVAEAIAVAEDTRLPRRSIVFPVPEDGFGPPQFPPEGLGIAFENYLQRLCEMDTVRRETGGIVLSEALRLAFDKVMEAAKVLEALGWPINYQQSVQESLQMTEFGLLNERLVERYENLPATVTLGQRLELIGGLTFNIQSRGFEDKKARVRRAFLTGKNRRLYEHTQLCLNDGDDGLSTRFMYRSEWMISPDKPGVPFRIYV